MTWGDPNSRAARAVERRARRGLGSAARRRARNRSKATPTIERRLAEERHSDVWAEQTERPRFWLFR